MKKIILLSVAVLFLAGCDTLDCGYKPNTKERQRIFKECMQIVPEGPKQTHYNDWSEVIKECENVAYYQSKEWKCTK